MNCMKPEMKRDFKEALTALGTAKSKLVKITRTNTDFDLECFLSSVRATEREIKQYVKQYELGEPIE